LIEGRELEKNEDISLELIKRKCVREIGEKRGVEC